MALVKQVRGAGSISVDGPTDKPIISGSGGGGGGSAAGPDGAVQVAQNGQFLGTNNFLYKEFIVEGLPFNLETLSIGGDSSYCLMGSGSNTTLLLGPGINSEDPLTGDDGAPGIALSSAVSTSGGGIVFKSGGWNPDNPGTVTTPGNIILQVGGFNPGAIATGNIIFNFAPDTSVGEQNNLTVLTVTRTGIRFNVPMKFGVSGTGGDLGDTIISQGPDAVPMWGVPPSDENLKTNIQNLGLGLDFVLNLRPVMFEWKDTDNTKHNGLIAQEVLALQDDYEIGGIVKSNKKDGEHDHYGINWNEIGPVLIKSIQELTARVAELESKVESN